MKIGHINVGQAENTWEQLQPEWLGPPVYDALLRPTGMCHVHYWNPEWRALCCRRIDALIAQGYQGALLGGTDQYQLFGHREDVEALVVALIEHARTVDPNFVVTSPLDCFRQLLELVAQNETQAEDRAKTAITR